MLHFHSALSNGLSRGDLKNVEADKTESIQETVNGFLLHKEETLHVPIQPQWVSKLSLLIVVLRPFVKPEYG